MHLIIYANPVEFPGICEKDEITSAEIPFKHDLNINNLHLVSYLRSIADESKEVIPMTFYGPTSFIEGIIDQLKTHPKIRPELGEK